MKKQIQSNQKTLTRVITVCAIFIMTGMLPKQTMAQLTSGMVAYYSFDNLVDGTGLNPTAVLQGSAALAMGINKLPFAFSTSGVNCTAVVNNHVTIPQTNAMNFGSASFAIAGWVRLQTHVTNAIVMGNTLSGTGWQVISISNGNWQLVYDTDTQNPQTLGGNVGIIDEWAQGGSNSNNWMFIAFSVNTATGFVVPYVGQCALHADGTSNGTPSLITKTPVAFTPGGSINVTSSPFYLSKTFRASWDEFRAWNRALTLSEVQQLYNNGVPYTCSSSTVPTLSSSSTANCGTVSTTLNISTGTLNNATSWQWYSGLCGGTNVGSGTSISVSPVSTTTYYARGEGGCAAAGACGSITITVNPLPTVTASSVSGCTGSSIALSGSPAGGTWSVANPYTGSSTTYTHTYTDGNGCTNTSSSATITVNPLPTATASNVSGCTGSSIALSGSPAGGTWSVANPYSGPATTYTHTYTDGNGCTNTSSSATITVNPLPTVTASNVSGCTGSSIVLSGIPAGGTWSVANPYTGPATTYTHTYTNGNGCTNTSSSATITVNALPVVTASNVSGCAGSSIALSGSPAGGTWSVANPYTGPATTYTHTFTNGNGCTSTSTPATITINSLPAAAISSNSTICNGQSATVNLTFSGPSPYNYEVWTGTGTIYSGTTNSTTETVLVTPPSAGTFNYVVKSISNGTCAGNGSGSAIVSVSGGPPTSSITFITGGVSTACNGDVVQLSTNVVSGSNISYNWVNGSGTSGVLFGPTSSGPFSSSYTTSTNTAFAQFSVLGSGQSGYNICAFASNGCAPSTNTKCQFIRGGVSTPGFISGPAVVCSSQSGIGYTAATVTGATVYTWSFPGATITSAQGQGTTAISMDFPVNTSGQLCVTAGLSCNNTGAATQSPPICKTISSNVATPTVIDGPAAVCPGGVSDYTYSVVNDPNAASYEWTLPAGVVAVGTANTNTIVVHVNSLAGTPSICVEAVSPCAPETSISRCKGIASETSPVPSNIIGPANGVCSGNQLDYSITNVPGTVYTWTVPAAATGITYSTAAVHFTITPPFSSGQVTVTASNGICGSSAARNIVIYGPPAPPATITSNPNPVCAGQPVQFTAATPVGAGPNYNWTITGGGTITSSGPPYGNQITAIWGGGNGTVSVSAKNTCGVGGAKIFSVVPGCREEFEAAGGSGSKQFAAYPNPAHDQLTLSIDAKEGAVYNVQLLDLSGRVVQSESALAEAGLNKYRIDLTHVAKGVYMMNVQSVAGSWKTKMVVE